MIKGLKKTTLELRGDHKGPVFNLDLSDLDLEEIPLLYRAKGNIGEAHFHEGWDPSNNPQKILMIKGKMEINCEDLDGNKETIIMKEGDLLEVPKMVLHDYVILEDTVYGELRKTKFNKDKVDKLFLDDFRKLQK